MGSFLYESNDALLFEKWKIDYLVYDYCNVMNEHNSFAPYIGTIYIA